MLEVKIFAIESYKVITEHTIELDVEQFLVTPNTVAALLKHTAIRGKAFILFLQDRVYYATRDKNEYLILHLTAEVSGELN